MPTTESRHQVKIQCTDGLHLRLAAQFAQLASQFQAEVRLSRCGLVVNGKSIIDLLTLAAECGSRIDVEARGTDAEEAVEALTGFLAALPLEGVERQPEP
jgi:phosphocarrier protein HPr